MSPRAREAMVEQTLQISDRKLSMILSMHEDEDSDGFSANEDDNKTENTL